MPVKAERSDRTLLRDLLASGKLTKAEQAAFQKFQDALTRGTPLDPKQRLWADSVYQKYDVGGVKIERKKALRARIRSQIPTIFDQMANPPVASK